MPNPKGLAWWAWPETLGGVCSLLMSRVQFLLSALGRHLTCAKACEKVVGQAVGIGLVCLAFITQKKNKINARQTSMIGTKWHIT